MSSNSLDSELGLPTKVNPKGRLLGSRIPRGSLAVGAPGYSEISGHEERMELEGNRIGRELHTLPARLRSRGLDRLWENRQLIHDPVDALWTGILIDLLAYSSIFLGCLLKFLRAYEPWRDLRLAGNIRLLQ